MFRKVFFISLFIVINTLIISYLYAIYDGHRKELVDNHTVEPADLYQGAITTFRLNAKAVFDNTIMQLDVLDVLEELSDADGRSFLRMYGPEKYRDPLFDVRYSIKAANIIISIEHFTVFDDAMAGKSETLS